MNIQLNCGHIYINPVVTCILMWTKIGEFMSACLPTPFENHLGSKKKQCCIRNSEILREQCNFDHGLAPNWAKVQSPQMAHLGHPKILPVKFSCKPPSSFRTRGPWSWTLCYDGLPQKVQLLCIFGAKREQLPQIVLPAMYFITRDLKFDP